MGDNRLADLWETQKSLTEWLDDIKHKDTEAIRREDNNKRERLKVLNEVIGLPFDKPAQFEAIELSDSNRKFQKYLNKHCTELCALRLIPKEDGLPKLRTRGKSIKEAYEWYKEQEIDTSKYRADFIPHPPDNLWATIFVINKYGIQGEIIAGGHHQLTQGFHETSKPHVFRYDFKNWMVHPEGSRALEHLKVLADHLFVPLKEQQKILKKELQANFVNDYLVGYFETTHSTMGTWFIDYSTSLGKMYENMVINAPTANEVAIVVGLSGSAGKVKGRVKIVDPGELDKDFEEGSILVCTVTTPLYVPLMQKAAAIVTDQGGILSHAAIVARELGKPCIVGTENASKILKNDQLVTVNATDGSVIVSQ